MGIKISELTSGSSVNGDDQYPAVQGSSTKKFSPSQMASYVLNTFSSLSLGGVVRTVKAAIDAIATTVASHTTLLGNSTMGTTATTVTGAIAEHETDITTLNSNLNDLNSHVNSALAAPLAIYRNSNNGTTYTFPCVRKESGSYSYFLMIGGAGSSAAFVYHGFVSVNSTGNAVTLAKIGGASALTFTASYNGTDTLTITASATAYGGIRLIWFS